MIVYNMHVHAMYMYIACTCMCVCIYIYRMTKHIFVYFAAKGGYQQPPAGGYQQPPASQAPPPAAQAPPTSKPASTQQVTSQMAQMKVNEEAGHGTIKAPPTIDAEADATVLRKAMKGLGECVCVCVSVFVYV